MAPDDCRIYGLGRGYFASARGFSFGPLFRFFTGGPVVDSWRQVQVGPPLESTGSVVGAIVKSMTLERIICVVEVAKTLGQENLFPTLRASR